LVFVIIDTSLTGYGSSGHSQRRGGPSQGPYPSSRTTHVEAEVVSALKSKKSAPHESSISVASLESVVFKVKVTTVVV
jgi:hypothetical protein